MRAPSKEELEGAPTAHTPNPPTPTPISVKCKEPRRSLQLPAGLVRKAPPCAELSVSPLLLQVPDLQVETGDHFWRGGVGRWRGVGDGAGEQGEGALQEPVGTLGTPGHRP